MTQHGGPTDHKGFRIVVLSENGKFEAWAERIDRALIEVGYGIAPKVGTLPANSPGAALSEALAFIDKGQWKAHHKN